jgi:hypothetical protein
MGSCCASRDFTSSHPKFITKSDPEESPPEINSDYRLEHTAYKTQSMSKTLTETHEQSSDNLEFFSPDQVSPELPQEVPRISIQSPTANQDARNSNNIPRNSRLRALNLTRISTDSVYDKLPPGVHHSTLEPVDLKSRASVPILSPNKRTKDPEFASEWGEWIRNLKIEEIIPLLDDATSIQPTTLSVGWHRTILNKRNLALARITELLKKGKIQIETLIDFEIIEKLFSFIETFDEELRFWTDIFIMHLLKVYNFVYIAITEDEVLLFNFEDMLKSPDEQMRCAVSKIVRYLLKASNESRALIEEYQESVFPKSLYRITHSFTHPKYLHSHLVTLKLLISNPNYSFMALYSPNKATKFLEDLKNDIDRVKSHPEGLRFEYRLTKIYESILEDVKEYEYMKAHPVSIHYPRVETMTKPTPTGETLRGETPTKLESHYDVDIANEANEVLHMLDDISNILEDTEIVLSRSQSKRSLMEVSDSESG